MPAEASAKAGAFSVSWLLITIIAYLVFAVSFLIDKYLLSGPVPNPKAYAFYVGILGVLVLLIIPFVGFSIPSVHQIAVSFLAGAVGIYSIFWLYQALSKFEASRVVPAVGGMAPVFTMALIYLFSRGEEILGLTEFFAFLLLVSGSVLITYEAGKTPLKGLPISTLTAFFTALSFVLTKYVYLNQPFWSGLIWIRFGGITAALFFLFYQEVRQDFFSRQRFLFLQFLKKFETIREKNFTEYEVPLSRIENGKTAIIFLANQALASFAVLIREWAVFLAPLAYITIINALAGVQYVFLLLLIFLVAWLFPGVLKEKISGKVLFRKIFAILFIGIGLAVLALH